MSCVTLDCTMRSVASIGDGTSDRLGALSGGSCAATLTISPTAHRAPLGGRPRPALGGFPARGRAALPARARRRPVAHVLVEELDRPLERVLAIGARDERVPRVVGVEREGLPALAERGDKTLGLADRDPRVLLPVEDEHRRADP